MVRQLLKDIRYFLRQLFSSRIFLLALVMAGMFAVLIFTLFGIQIVNGSTYEENYTQLSLTTITNEATRGRIYDRNGNLLVYNQVAYSVTVRDTGNYANGYEWNDMLIGLVRILEENDETIVNAFPVAYDENGDPQFTTSSSSEFTTLLLNVYGLSDTGRLDEEDDEGNIVYRSDPTPEYLLDYAFERFGVGYTADGGTYELDPQTALDLLNIRYAMYLVSYIRYQTVTIATGISEETITEVLEHSDTMLDVSVDEDLVRVYNDPYCFSNIIGYTGTASGAELEQLQAVDESYEVGDIVGKTGIEQVMEQELSGTKGYTTVMVDSQGRIMQTLEEQEAVAGDDIYLTIDRDLQVGIYSMLEQTLASCILEHMTDEIVDPSEYTDSSKIPISIYDIWAQMFNNDVISFSRLSSPEASAAESRVYSSYDSRRQSVLSWISSCVSENDTGIYTDAQYDYLDYVLEFLSGEGILSEDSNDQYYSDWYNDRIPFHTYIEHAVSEGWFDISGLGVDASYASASEIMTQLETSLPDLIGDDAGLRDLIFKELVYSGEVSGGQVLLCMFAQGALSDDPSAVDGLASGTVDAYSYTREKIADLEITAAQIALDPCTASCVVLDVETSAPLAVVSYPGYDLNRMSGRIDTAYYNSLLSDGSNPLYNNATQTRIAPGSTFKPVTAIAALEEGIITSQTIVEDQRVFTEAGMNIRCWIYPGTHGDVDLRHAITQSCNYYFCEMGYELSFTSNGGYSENYGLERIRRYASMFGLDSPTGIEIVENAPQFSDTSAIASAMGQGTHAYTCVSLARYVSTLANGGDLYDLTLLSQRTDYEGQILEIYSPELVSTADVSASTLNTVRSAMNGVTTEGGACYRIFRDCAVDSAGKTGTAEASSLRPPHAVYVGYAPYNDPDIAFSVIIPYGYGSTYAAEMSCSLLNYYYGQTTLDQILSGGAASLSGTTVGD